MVCRPWATSSATRRSVGVSAPEEGGRPPTRASSARARSAHTRAPMASKSRAAASSAVRAAAFCRARRNADAVGEAGARQLDGIGTPSCRSSASRSRARAPSTSPRAPASSPRQRAAAASADAPPQPPRVALEPAEQLLRRIELAERDQRLDVVGDDPRRRPARRSARRAGTRPAARAPATASAGLPADCSSRPSAARAKCSAGRPFVRAATASARSARSRPCVQVAGDRVGERPQREQVRADRGLARLLGQRLALVRVADARRPRRRARSRSGRPGRARRPASSRRRARRPARAGSRRPSRARSSSSHHSQVNATWNSGRAITRAMAAAGVELQHPPQRRRRAGVAERRLGQQPGADAPRRRSRSRSRARGGRAVLDGLAQPLPQPEEHPGQLVVRLGQQLRVAAGVARSPRAGAPPRRAGRRRSRGPARAA